MKLHELSSNNKLYKYINIKFLHIGYVNTFLLEAIKAYDECSAQQAELGYLIENLSRWFYEQSKEDYIFLNLAKLNTG